MKEKRENLIIARKMKGWTQEELAKSVGISRAYLANIERGEHDPSLKVAQLISCQLELSVDLIFFQSNVR